MNTDFLNFPIFAIEETENLLKSADGANQKNIFINIFENSERSELLPFLEKILSAVKLNMKEDVLLLPISHSIKFNFSELGKKKEIKKAIFFGQSPKSVGLQFQFEKYAILKMGEKEFLFVDDLAIIHDDQKLKKALWLSLKELFGV